jgi:hypothetical protein
MNAVIPSIPNPMRLLAHVGFAGWLARGVVAVRAIGPYAAIEVILPGGTLLAFLLWLYRHHRRGEPVRPLIARSLCKTRLGVRRIIEAARSARRPSLGDVSGSVCTACVRS